MSTLIRETKNSQWLTLPCMSFTSRAAGQLTSWVGGDDWTMMRRYCWWTDVIEKGLHLIRVSSYVNYDFEGSPPSVTKFVVSDLFNDGDGQQRMRRKGCINIRRTPEARLPKLPGVSRLQQKSVSREPREGDGI